ncbi:hypothetical protein [Halalkalibacter hemicellulosilyticus]|uniref:Uncharacterized protein n=1 Tax=Halalkalibacter hemicellulosilyticusJCM 9152 TaxID=1236971 RepID=W4QK28_9BACI|nr:hypothetical protein [Halalkalibacter hemicellulosilyticus]GAE32416.1 hypothetical protein JCM9152_3950 [Halalkalibacter hemicellulosilyticusJCM 9152]
MKLKALEGFKRAEIQMVIDTLKFSKKGKEESYKRLIDIALNKVITYRTQAELDGMEMKIMTHALMNKAMMLRAHYGMDKKSTERKHMYNLACTIATRRLQFQKKYGPSIEIEEAQTAGTVHAS